MRSLAVNLLLLFFACMSVLSLSEAALRVGDSSGDIKTVADLDSNKPLLPEHDALLGEILQRSSFDSIIYELRPNINTKFLHARLRTNRQGFRGDLCDISKQPGEFRIVGLGDSLMFGWGIPDGQEYLALLKRKLQERAPEIYWRITNTAVPGYNTRLEIETLAHKALRCEPDMVILGFLESNDFELPYFVEAAPRGFSLSGLRIVRAVMRRFELLTKHDFARALDKLSALSSQHGFGVLVYVHEKLSEETQEMFLSRKFRIVEAWPEIVRQLGSGDLDRYRKSRFTLSPEDPHPSIEGHQLAATLLFDSGLGAEKRF